MKNQRKGKHIKKSILLDHQLTNDELIKILKKFPKDAPIWIEGCDCYGVASGAKTLVPDGILITINN
jgi:hypothetical protein